MRGSKKMIFHVLKTGQEIIDSSSPDTIEYNPPYLSQCIQIITQDASIQYV